MTSCANQKMTSPPVAEEIPHFLEVHGERRVDPFFWMRERESEKVLNHLKAENSYTETVLSPVRALREKVLGEMKSRIKQDDSSYPFLQKGYRYYRRFHSGKEYPIFSRKKKDSEKEEVLLYVSPHQGIE